VPISERGVRKIVEEYVRSSGITKKVSPHGFRHTFATQKAEKVVSPYQLQEWLGHARLDTTQIYVHMSKKNAGRVMEQTSL
jgi:integrase/recombinase XerC